MQFKKVAGLIVVIAAVVLIVVFGQEFRSGSPGTASPPESSPGSAPSITVKGKIGGEKVELMKNPAVQKILRDTYHLQVELTKEGPSRWSAPTPARATSCGPPRRWRPSSTRTAAPSRRRPRWCSTPPSSSSPGTSSPTP